jgi:hypothetical protein
MAKRSTRRKTKPARTSRERKIELAERRELERGVRYQRKIVQLCRQLRGLIVKADDALRSVGRIANERDAAVRLTPEDEAMLDRLPQRHDSEAVGT